MKELTIQEKAERYDKFLERAANLHKDAVEMENSMVSKTCEIIFPELKESEDERIRRALIDYFDDANKADYNPLQSYGVHTDKAIAWLEKQGEPIDREKVQIGARKDVALSIMDYLDNNSVGMCLSNMECEDIEDAVVDSDWSKVYDYMKKKLEKQGEQKSTMIQWKGNNLKEVIDFTGVYKKGFEKWFHNSWEEYKKYVHEHNNIFKIFNEDGSHIEVPVGAWIIRTPDGYNIASKYVFRQKPSEWSNEDEKMFEYALDMIEWYSGKDEDKSRLVSDWLKSLKDRYTWKPSDEQLRVLHDAAIYIDNSMFPYKKGFLMKLYKQLKKLREE